MVAQSISERWSTSRGDAGLTRATGDSDSASQEPRAALPPGEEHTTRARAPSCWSPRLHQPSSSFQAVDYLKQGRLLLPQGDEISMWRPYAGRTANFPGFIMGALTVP